MDENTKAPTDVEDPVREKGCFAGCWNSNSMTANDAGNGSKLITWSRVKEICDPRGKFVSIWNKIFVTSCVIGVSLDPLFFYILIINQNNKCLQLDKTLSFVALLLRSLTDFISLVHLICEIYDCIKTYKNKLGTSGDSKTSNGGNPDRDRKSKLTQLFWSILVDFFALLPIPQMLIVFTFNKTRGSGYLEHRKVVNVFLLGQYIPRIFRIHISSNELKKTTGIWIKSLFNFFLYILASHVLGAFWYFFSIQREMSCWHQACVNYSPNPRRCIKTFYCDDDRYVTSRNITFLNDRCPLNIPDGVSPPFNFGIFLDSLQNQNTEHIKFGKKFFYSFWWGLRNLSNFGTNLTTTMYVWENLFAILISISGLLLFLYLIGNVQTFMQMQAAKSEDIRLKIMRKKRELLLWTDKHEDIPESEKEKIRNSLKQKLKQHKRADLQNDRFSILPLETRHSLQRCLCMGPLQKLLSSRLRHMDTNKVLEMMCNNMKAVTYEKNSFIFRKEDPLDCMLFIIEGTIWTYSMPCTSTSDSTSTNEGGIKGRAPAMAIERHGKGDFYGEELLEWASDNLKELPMSTKHIKSLTKVEAFVLMAADLEAVVKEYPHAAVGLNHFRNDPHHPHQDVLEETSGSLNF